jgi:hypothetical protein
MLENFQRLNATKNQAGITGITLFGTQDDEHFLLVVIKEFFV